MQKKKRERQNRVMETERTTLNGCFHCTHVKGKRRSRRKVQRQEGNRSDSLAAAWSESTQQHPFSGSVLLTDRTRTVKTKKRKKKFEWGDGFRQKSARNQITAPSFLSPPGKRSHCSSGTLGKPAGLQNPSQNSERRREKTRTLVAGSGMVGQRNSREPSGARSSC